MIDNTSTPAFSFSRNSADILCLPSAPRPQSRHHQLKKQHSPVYLPKGQKPQSVSRQSRDVAVPTTRTRIKEKLFADVDLLKGGHRAGKGDKGGGNSLPMENHTLSAFPSPGAG